MPENSKTNGETAEPKKRQNKNSLGRAWAEYVLCLILATIYLIFLDGNAGMFIVAALLAAPIFSFLIMLYCRYKISFKVCAEEENVAKKKAFVLGVTLHSSAFLPSPFITLTIRADGHFLCEEKPRRFSLRPGAMKTIDTEITGILCGAGLVGAESVVMTDFLGLFRCLLRSKEDAFITVGVTPNIPQTSLKNALIQTLSAIAGTDESEETVDLPTVSGGTAGYQHRAYEPGDPIKRINWKLSSKKDKLMVRLDEGTADARQFAVLDCFPPETNLIDADRLIEGLLAFSATLVKLGKELVLYTYDKAWTERRILTIEDVYALQFHFSRVSPVSAPSPALPAALTSGTAGAPILTIFTDTADSREARDSVAAHGTMCFYAIARPIAGISGDTWLIDDGFGFSHSR